jgi:hypothetical protein
MKNLFSIALLAVALFFLSCSSENSTSEDDFFNLNVGSKWVYKRYYNYSEQPGIYNLVGVDSVEVVETVNLNGLAFSRVRHKYTHQNGSPQITYAYLRVNPEGHLVGFSQLEALPEESAIVENNLTVIHPGEDLAYQNSVSQPWGIISYHADGQTGLAVEGNSYNVWRFTADAIPTDQSLSTVTVFSDFEAQTGLIRLQNATVEPFWRSEDRLVSYDLN